ncbi:MAG: putative metallo-hydrolase [Firmicutes bacterium ADurb.Bin182]|nr:MAG: putative metallo-hydrolase [Firmicutes bacterium ADurb.Bin182]
MVIHTLQTGPLDVNTYIVHTKDGTDCAVIDPADADIVIRSLSDMGLSCTHILLTHGHFDHIMGVSRLKKHYGSKVLIHPDDAPALYEDTFNLSYAMGLSVEHCSADLLAEDGFEFEAAGLSFTVIHTPGHSKGSVCYLVKDEHAIFSGDTLFRLSAGRSDLPGSDSFVLYDSIVLKLFALDGDYDVYPGHMGKTTLEFERKRNPFIKHWKQNEW